MGYGLGLLASRFRRPDDPEAQVRSALDDYRQFQGGGVAEPLSEGASAVEQNLRLPARSDVMAAPQPPAPPRLISRDALAIKEAGTDYPGPTAVDIKAASGMRLTPRTAMPPATGIFNADAGPQSNVTPPALMSRESISPPSYNAPRPPLRAYSGSYGRYEDERASLPTEQQYMESRRPHGLLPRIGSALKLGGKLLLASGLNPITALEGVAIGAADPNANARYSYRTDVEPRSVARQQRYLGDASREIGMGNILDDNARAEQQMQINSELHRDQMSMNQEYRDAQRADRDRLRTREEMDYRLRVGKFQQDMAEAAAKAKTEQEKQAFQRAHDIAKLHLETGTPLPAELARALGAPDLSGATKPLGTGQERLSDYEASVGPEAYGVKSWNDLVDNPEYAPAYQQALESAKSFAQPGENPEEALNMLIAAGNVKLPPRQIPAYDYARKNPHPLKSAAAAARGRGQRLGGSRSSYSSGNASPTTKTRLSAGQVSDYAKANGWTPEQAASYLRSTGKYIVP